MDSFDFDRIVPLGIVALFGGLLLWLPIALLIGRRLGHLVGVGAGMVLFGLTGCAMALWLAWHVYVDTVVVQLARSACEVVPPPPELKPPRDRYRAVYALPEGGAPRRLVTEPSWAECPPAESPQRLRFRPAALSGGGAEVSARAEPDVRQAPMLIGVFAAFGGFGLLGGLIIGLSGLRDRGWLGQGLPAPPAPGSTRARLGTAFTMAGHLVLLGSLAMVGWAEERLGMVWGTDRVFRSVAIACACWAAAALLRRRLSVEMLLTLVLVGGGFWLAAASLRLMSA